MIETDARAVLVESYWRLAWQWVQEQRGDHGRWHDCLACADLRRYRGQSPLPIKIGGHVVPSFDPGRQG